MMIAALCFAIAFFLMAPMIFEVIGYVFEEIFGLVTDPSLCRVVEAMLELFAVGSLDNKNHGWMFNLLMMLFFGILAYGVRRYGGKGKDDM